MAYNYNDYGYENNEYDDRKNILKKVLIIFLVIVAIVGTLLLIKGCTKKEPTKQEDPKPFDYKTTILEAGKKYYENSDYSPKTAYECNQVILQTLIDEGLIDSNNFGTCNLDLSYVKVCILPNGNQQFTPWLVCNDTNYENEFSELTEGTVNDVVEDSTYVEFLFIPQVMKTGGEELGPVEEIWKSDITYQAYKTLKTTKYYRYKDKLFTWKLTTKKYYTSSGEKSNASDVKEYYTIAPNSNYNQHDSKTTEAYKWYTTDSTKVYALSSNNTKALSPTAIGEYNNKEDGATVKMYQTRTVKSEYKPVKYYACSSSSSSTNIVYQTAECKNTVSNPYQKDIVYSCKLESDNSISVKDNIVSSTSKCYTFSDWSTPKSVPCDTNLPTCRIQNVMFYYWYKYESNGEKKYIPSGKSTASKENIYYVKSPKSGAIKDTSTKSTAYKWYKSTTTTTTDYNALAPKGYSSATKTDNYKWTDWTEWSTKNPKVSDGRTREIESQVKIKLQQIKGTSEEGWNNLEGIDYYLSKKELISAFRDKGYDVNTLEDIDNNGEIKYQIKMYVRNIKENDYE